MEAKLFNFSDWSSWTSFSRTVNHITIREAAEEVAYFYSVKKTTEEVEAILDRMKPDQTIDFGENGSHLEVKRIR